MGEGRRKVEMPYICLGFHMKVANLDTNYVGIGIHNFRLILSPSYGEHISVIVLLIKVTKLDTGSVKQSQFILKMSRFCHIEANLL